jgi:Cu2+-exporting ATPase
VCSFDLASRHPYSKAVVNAARERGVAIVAAPGVLEVPGSGLVAPCAAGGELRLGSEAWVKGDDHTASARPAGTLWFSGADGQATALDFEDAIRTDAGDVVQALRAAGYDICLVSGDRRSAVSEVADAVGIDAWWAGVKPDGKIALIEELKARGIEELKARGKTVLMVGDGLNDAPALAAAHASISPSTAADISQTAADAVFQGQALAPILETMRVAGASQRMSLQNFAIAIGYNIVFVPLAVAGHVTPLIAALAMSLSSIAVTVNALRLRTRSLSLTPARRPS